MASRGRPRTLFGWKFTIRHAIYYQGMFQYNSDRVVVIDAHTEEDALKEVILKDRGATERITWGKEFVLCTECVGKVVYTRVKDYVFEGEQR
jgi:hypothetical protein